MAFPTSIWRSRTFYIVLASSVAFLVLLGAPLFPNGLLHAKNLISAQSFLSSSYLLRPSTFAVAKATLRGYSQGVSERSSLLLTHKAALFKRFISFESNGTTPPSTAFRLAVQNNGGGRPWAPESIIPWSSGFQPACPVACELVADDPLHPPDAFVAIEPCFSQDSGGIPGLRQNIPSVAQMVENFYHGLPQGGDMFAYGASEASMSRLTGLVARADFISNFELDSDIVSWHSLEGSATTP